MGLALQNAQGEVGPPKKLKTSSLSLPRRGGQSSNGGLKDSGRGSLRRTWWLGQTRASEDSPQALRAWPSSPWPPRLPLREANPPSPSLWDRVSGSLPLLPGRAQSGLASATGKLPGFSQRAPCTHKTQVPGFTPNLGVCMF